MFNVLFIMNFCGLVKRWISATIRDLIEIFWLLLCVRTAYFMSSSFLCFFFRISRYADPESGSLLCVTTSIYAWINAFCFHFECRNSLGKYNSLWSSKCCSSRNQVPFTIEINLSLRRPHTKFTVVVAFGISALCPTKCILPKWK